MTLPDCRNDEYYNEDFLNEKDKEFLKGFDWAVEYALDNAFNNLDCILQDDAYLQRKLEEKVPDVEREDYEVELYDGTTEKRTIETNADLIRSRMLDWAESERDELIVSMIDNMDEVEYKKNREAAMEQNKRSDNPKEYYNTRKFFVTGKKERSDE